MHNNKFGLDKCSLDKEVIVIKKNRKEKIIYKGLRDNKKKIQVKIKEQTFEAKIEIDPGNYL